MHRFHAPDLPDEGALLALPDEEARHLTQVLRLSIGDAVRVFDGRGREHHARVENAGRRRVEVRVGPPAIPAPEAGIRITLAASLLKADKFDDVVRDAAMLGAAVVQPLVTSHTDVPAARAGSTVRLDRWRRVALSSTKQCGRAVIVEVAAPASLDERLPYLPSPWIVLAEPTTGKGGPLPARPGTATVFVGPEGGWSAGEIAAFSDGGAHFLQLGARTLRADAAPLVALSVLLYAWGEL